MGPWLSRGPSELGGPGRGVSCVSVRIVRRRAGPMASMREISKGWRAGRKITSGMVILLKTFPFPVQANIYQEFAIASEMES